MRDRITYSKEQKIWVPETFLAYPMKPTMKANAAFILSFLHHLDIADKKAKFHSVSNTYLERYVGSNSLKKILMALEEDGFIKVRHTYSKNAALCKGYVLADKDVKFVQIPASERIAKKMMARQNERLGLIKSNPDTLWLYESLKSSKINKERAIELFNTLKFKSRHHKNLVKTMLVSILNENYYITVDKKTERVFSNYTNIMKEFRNLIEIDGQATAEVDIANSQPALLATMYPYDCEERQRYIKLVKDGQFYETINNTLPTPMDDKKKIKTGIYACVFFNRIKASPVYNAFAKNFPLLAGYMGSFNPKDLAIELQRREARIVIDGVVAKLRKMGVKAITIHDSIRVEARLVEIAKYVMEQVCNEVLGFTPTIR